MDPNTLLTGLLIFLARIADVSIGTVRTILTVQGRTTLSFILGFLEVTIWITVVSTVVHLVKETPILVLFYASGYATGNVVGILVERKLAFGMNMLRVISKNHGQELADLLRKKGQPVTVFTGQGMTGPVLELYIVCRRRDTKWILPLIKKIDPKAFYTIEAAREVRKVLQPIAQPVTGWRATMKKK